MGTGAVHSIFRNVCGFKKLEVPAEANEADPGGQHEGAAPEPPALDAWAMLERVGSGGADTAERTAVVDLEVLEKINLLLVLIQPVL